MKTKKLMCKFLSLLMLASLTLASCQSSDPANVPSDDTSAGDTESSVVTTEAPRPELELPNKDFGGETITIMSSSNPWNFREFFYDEEMKGSAVNDAVYKRNSMVEELLNVHIETNDVPRDQIAGNAQRNVQAGDASIDIYTPQMVNVYSLASQGCLVDLVEMPVMNIDNPWWSQNMKRDLMIGNKMYMMTGDILFSTKELNVCFVFNGAMLDEIGYDNMYDIVLDGDWTVDLFYEICTQMSRDLDGNGAMDVNDQYGYVHTYESAYGMYTCCGGQLAGLDEDGKFMLLEDDLEKSVNILEKLNKIYGDRTLMADINSLPETWTSGTKMFKNNQVAMRSANIYNLQVMRDMVSDFGIIPMPKYDEQQDNYVSQVYTTMMKCITVPVTNEKLECTGSVLEALAYYSKDTTVEAYYDVTLKGIVSRDPQSQDMLDIIFSTEYFDLIESFKFGGTGNLDGLYRAVCLSIDTPDQFMSRYQSLKEATLADMEKKYELFAGE